MFTHYINKDTELRQLQYYHTKPLFKLIDKNRDHLREYLDWVYEAKSEEDTHNFIKSRFKAQMDDKGLVASIWYKNEIAGMIGFHDINHTHRMANIGYWLGKEFTGKGIVTDACRDLINYGFNSLNLNRVTILASTNNTASRAIAERLGFKHEGCTRDEMWVHDRFIDMEQYGMLVKDWENK